MPLFTDADHVTAADLAAIDYEVADVASTHKLTLEGPQSICGTAWADCADALTAQFRQFGSGAVFGPFQAINQWNWPAGTTQASTPLSSIVVSDPLEKQSAIENWMVYVALAGLYRAVSNASGDKDRYQRKQKAYEAEAGRAWKTLSRIGLPVVSTPLAAPGATHERNAGAFRDQDVTAIVSGTRDAQQGEVAITYWDAVRGVESGPSRIVGFSIDVNSLLRVSRSGVTPPAAATHWNVYASVLPGQPLTRQAQVAIASATWTAAAAIAASATQLGPGQLPERHIAFSNFWQRA
jgi:hypothetical protein